MENVQQILGGELMFIPAQEHRLMLSTSSLSSQLEWKSYEAIVANHV